MFFGAGRAKVCRGNTEQALRIEPQRTNHTISERNDQARSLCDLVRSCAIVVAPTHSGSLSRLFDLLNRVKQAC